MSSANKKPLMENRIPSKLLAREPSSLSNHSFRVYYGKATGSVPFLWESQPGTPKHPTTTTPCSNDQSYAFPPLTPPPSYFSESIKKKTKSRNLLHIILPKLITLRRSNLSYKSSSSSCSSSEPSSPAVGQEARKRHAATAGLSSPNTHFFSYKKGEEKEEERSHTLMLCLGARW